ncbi:MAG: GerAB/ArcD/ProY family transporter [Clostridia bacterium]|nr:GerAB/ArcD/ProY family transporter [Clostridia bacterium]
MKIFSKYRLFTVIAFFIFGNTLLTKTVFQGGKDFYLSALIAVCFAAIILVAVTAPFLKYPYLTAGEYIKMKTGKAGEKAINALLLIFLSLSALKLYLEFIKFLTSVSLNITPNYFIAIAVSVFVLLLSLLGIENISAYTSAVFIFAAAFAVYSVISGASLFKIETFMPLADIKTEKMLGNAAEIFLFILSDVAAIIFFCKRGSNGKDVLKSSLAALAVWFAVTAAVGALPIAVFGEGYEIFKYPVFQALASVKGVSFLPKNSFLFLVLGFIIMIIKLSVTLSFIGEVTENITGGKRTGKARIITRAVPVVLITSVASFLLINGIKAEEEIKMICAVAAVASFSALLILNLKRYRRK